MRLEYFTTKKGKVSSLVVLDNINLDVNDNEFFVIIGPSGCGKSTLLHSIDGLVAPTSGKMTIDGREILTPGPDRAMVFQEPCLIPWKSVADNVRLGLQVRKDIPRDQAEERTERYLKMVNLWSFKDYRPWQLSGGMKQRVGLARALALETKLLLMDEPFAALDEQTKEFLQADLQSIFVRTRQTIVYVTHSLDEAIYLGDRVGIMSARPAKFKDIIDISIPRPRPIEVKHSNEFLSYRNRAWSSLKDEVMKARTDLYTEPKKLESSIEV